MRGFLRGAVGTASLPPSIESITDFIIDPITETKFCKSMLRENELRKRYIPFNCLYVPVCDSKRVSKSDVGCIISLLLGRVGEFHRPGADVTQQSVVAVSGLGVGQ